jgi:hypothetical protein
MPDGQRANYRIVFLNASYDSKMTEWKVPFHSLPFYQVLLGFQNKQVLLPLDRERSTRHTAERDSGGLT